MRKLNRPFCFFRLRDYVVAGSLTANAVSILCLLFVFTVQPVKGQGDTPITINFDDLPNNTVVTNQYFNQYGVTFSSGNPFLPLHTQQACNLCAPISPPNFVCTWPDLSGQVIVEFSRPVSNLSFIILASDAFFQSICGSRRLSKWHLE